MSTLQKALDRLLRGEADKNIGFSELRRILKSLQFSERIRGDHYIFTRHGVKEILNLQPRGANAKPYQVKQVRDVILKYHLTSKRRGERESTEEKDDGKDGSKPAL